MLTPSMGCVKARKGIDQKEDLLHRAGRVELAAIELKNAVTEERLNDHHVQGEQNPMDLHHRVGNEIRGAIRNSGATMPEDLKPEEPIKELTRRQKFLQASVK